MLRTLARSFSRSLLALALAACSSAAKPPASPATAAPAAGAAAAPAAEAAAPAAPVALHPFEGPDGLSGYQDAAGKTVLPARYHVASDFSARGIASVVDDKGWAYIDASGTVLVRPFVFDNGPDPFSDGVARYVDGGKIGFFDESGKIVIPARYDFAGPFSDGLAAVCDGCTKKMMGEHYTMEGGHWGYVDREGKVAIPMTFEHAGEFHDGRATVTAGGQSHEIDKSGKAVPPAK